MVILRFKRLETRLLLSFLLLASVPSLLLTLITMGQINSALDYLQNPVIEASLLHSATVSGELVDRMGRDAGALLSELPDQAPGDATEARMRDMLRATGFEFAAWNSPGGEARIVTVADTPAMAGLNEGFPVHGDWARIDEGQTPDLVVGTVLRFFEGNTAVGLRVDPQIANAITSAGEDYEKYLKLRFFEEIQKKKVWFSSIGIFLLTAAAAFLAARVTARRISRPVEELAHGADRIAAGELSHRASARGDGEIANLVTAFNRMGSELEKSQEELIRVERIAAWRDVAQRIAHEIRNPLTPVRLAVHRLKSRVPQDAETQGCLQSIAEEVENLQRISETFAEFARMPEPRFEETDLTHIVRSVLELFRGATEGVGLRFEGPDSCPLVADRNLVRRAVTNLVKNASEALVDGGMILAKVLVTSNRALLEISDDGPGIPAKIRESLFRPGVSGKPGGSGLGLSMVQRIALDHRGRLSCRHLDPGTCFVLEIPLDMAVSK